MNKKKDLTRMVNYINTLCYKFKGYRNLVMVLLRSKVNAYTQVQGSIEDYHFLIN